jgi:hypothetical protein
MPRKTIDLNARPLLDIASYGRRGPARRDHLSPAEIDRIRRTVDRTPEVMIKVLSKGGRDIKAVRPHLDYLSRRGQLELETDDGERLSGKDAQRALLEQWDLDIDEQRRRSGLSPAEDRRSPKLVHKLMFSMPAGTPPEKVLAAVRNFAREEFALQHRYAMVLHTDEPHPHVHMVVKAVSEQGERLNIRKDTLRHWRAEFARHLRALGVPANATERAVRGEARAAKLDGIYRAMRRGESSHMRQRVEAAVRILSAEWTPDDVGRAKLAETRSAVTRGWTAAGELLERQGETVLAGRVRTFVGTLRPPRTDRELIAEQLHRHLVLQRTRALNREDAR